MNHARGVPTAGWPFLLLAALAVGCGGKSGGATDAGPACVATFSGNFADTVTANACPTLASDADGGPLDVLDFSLASAVAGAPTQISIDLGAAYGVGDFSSETVANWSAIGINTSDCEFSAGDNSVPAGSFTLTLSALAQGDAGPHGDLSVTQYVKAPPTVDCGPGDTEQIDVSF